jgi:serine/threonine protein kinase
MFCWHATSIRADFGIARRANEINGLTATNVTVGSVDYAAPEQLTIKALDGLASWRVIDWTIVGDPTRMSSATEY